MTLLDPVAETLQLGDIVAESENFLQTVFVHTNKKVGTNDKAVFIQINGPSTGYKSTWRFLKAVLFSMYGSAYLSQKFYEK